MKINFGLAIVAAILGVSSFVPPVNKYNSHRKQDIWRH